jgi:hypothetical protein
MIIKLSPQRSDTTLQVIKAGDTLTINGVPYNFSVIPEGATLPATATNCSFISGDVARIDGHLQLTLILPIGANPTAAQAFPLAIVDPPDGLLVLPGGAA